MNQWVVVAAVGGFVIGAIFYWGFLKFLKAVAMGGNKLGSNARHRWLQQQTYEQLLRSKQQIDEEIETRQPGGSNVK